MPKAYELGVLMVHGIGQQKEGGTLASFGEPIAQCVQDRLTRGKVDRELAPEDPRVELRHVTLEGKDETPAHAEVTLRNVGGLRREESGAADAQWLLAEAWWAESFPTPTYAEICRWALQILPWTVIAHFDRRVRRMGFKVVDSATRWQSIRAVFGVVAEATALIAALWLIPLLAGVIVAMLAVGSLPIPKIRDLIGSVQRTLAATVGDSYVFVGQHVAGGAIKSRVRTALGWLSERCERVAIVAHSQGGAVAHEIVRSDPLSQCDYLLTFGSGLRKLTEIRDAVRAPGQRWLWATSCVALGASVTYYYLLQHFEVLSRDIYYWTGIGTATVLILLAMTSMWRRKSGKHTDRKKQWIADQQAYLSRYRLPQPNRVRWLDQYASADPVPNGALLDTYVPEEMRSREVHNQASMLSDHTAYWRNLDDFVARLSFDLLDLANLDVHQLDEDDGTRQYVATIRRRWRVGWLRWSRLVVVGSAVGLLLAWWNRAPGSVGKVLAAFQPLLDDIPVVGSWIAAGPPDRLGSLLGLTTVAVGAVVWLTLQRLAWSAWSHREIKRRYRREPYRFWEPTGLAFTGLLGGVTALAWGSVLLDGRGSTGLWLVGSLPTMLLGLVITDLLRITRFYGSWAALRALGPTHAAADRADARYRTELEIGMARGRAWAAIELGRLCRRDGDSDGARACWKEAVELGSGVGAWLLAQHFEESSPEQAIQAYERGIQLGDPRCPWFLGRLHEKLGDNAEARAAYSRGLELGSPHCAHCLGLLLGETDPEQAESVYRRGIQLGDALSAEFLGLQLVRQARRLRMEGAPEKKYEECLDEAASVLRTAVDRGSGRAAAELAEILRNRGNIAAARQALKDGVKLRDAWAATQLGELQLAEAQYESAAHSFQRAIDLTRDQTLLADSLFGLGRVFERMQQPEAAKRHFERAIAQPNAGRSGREAAMRLARLLEASLESKNRYQTKEKIRATLTRGAELGSIEACLALGPLWEEIGERAKAESAYRRAVELGSAEAPLQLGRLIRNCGTHWEEAREALFLGARGGATEAAQTLFDLIQDRNDVDGAKEMANLPRFLLTQTRWEALGDLLEEAGEEECAASIREEIL